MSVYDFALELFLIMSYVSRTGVFTVMHIYIYIAVYVRSHLGSCAFSELRLSPQPSKISSSLWC